MNVRKPVDYSAMFAALDMLMAADLPQMELYYEIGRLVSGRTEKGAAVAAAEYLCSTYPDVSGFSPRNLRRMREFYRTYEDQPRGAGRGHDRRLDAECGHSGGRTDSSGTGMVHSKGSAAWLVQADTIRENQIRCSQ